MLELKSAYLSFLNQFGPLLCGGCTCKMHGFDGQHDGKQQRNGSAGCAKFKFQVSVYLRLVQWCYSIFDNQHSQFLLRSLRIFQMHGA